MPSYVVRRVQDLLNERGLALRGSKVLLLGLTYKPNISDQRESPSRDVAEGFVKMGADVLGHDPHVTRFDIAGGQLPLAPDLDQALRDCDVAVLLQVHDAYDLDHIAALATAVFDTRGKMHHANVERL